MDNVDDIEEHVTQYSGALFLTKLIFPLASEYNTLARYDARANICLGQQRSSVRSIPRACILLWIHGEDLYKEEGHCLV